MFRRGGVAAGAGVTASSPASFDLCADGGIGSLKRRLQPRGTASGDAKERDQDEENANCSPIVGHRRPIRVSQLAARICNHFDENQSGVASLRIASLYCRLSGMEGRLGLGLRSRWGSSMPRVVNHSASQGVKPGRSRATSPFRPSFLLSFPSRSRSLRQDHNGRMK